MSKDKSSVRLKGAEKTQKQMKAAIKAKEAAEEASRVEAARAPKNDREQVQADRERIRTSNVVEYMLWVAEGRELPIRDAANRVVGFSEPPDLDQRIKVMQMLIRKTLPDLQAQQIEVTGSEGGPLQLVLAAGVVPPRSGDPKDVTPEPDAIEHAPRPKLDMPNFRTRKKTT